MGRCKICTHEKRKDIDRALLMNGQISKVAREHGLCRGTVWNHYQRHLPWRPQRRPEPVTVEEQLADLKFETRRLQALGETGESITNALQAVRERRALLELEARMEHRLDATHRRLLPPQEIGGEYEVIFENGRPRTVKKAS